ncbi:MAG: hypothetical protein C6P37_08690 [Caldibacillus debilis]|uniref:Uncharacterized protein n=1 Tax=Caldibacillus debilis TaxID=301148 RepID=A0A150MEM1_9BACI|nr:hypothetical protein B4135_1037 [Caldibacillus debilis]MBY6273997.1 hypothetical protein [Bacillaceae bacterium]REJ17280.1 MAG: hypothetical protein C6W57_06885 [Caldibacillus debilis]REJ28301.1 MAG: hypothetical protein C6P37_08690 [Caldibacillus debilis]REJ30124.1 MAG: hypothetical protein C6W56_03820 [Caldibacillus debilis]
MLNPIQAGGKMPDIPSGKRQIRPCRTKIRPCRPMKGRVGQPRGMKRASRRFHGRKMMVF